MEAPVWNTGGAYTIRLPSWTPMNRAFDDNSADLAPVFLQELGADINPELVK